ncbi:uncharacterized protein EV154DRAFT_487082 [Mucor mucedo]|uniref:uncharacterized protein n=1 Tax=Mucor mucedo TaxID=29922 RepID=UPI002220EE99|nr:uncharacterized protein EV154DRAFT_487082 [Mucor mucedo]KAI7873757.1 hypothetical protein EV154DRAFT_487082 [Mucor mucedo]
MYERSKGLVLGANVVRSTSANIHPINMKLLMKRISLKLVWKPNVIPEIDVLKILQFSGFGLLSKYSCDKIMKFHRQTWTKELDSFQQNIPMLMKLKTLRLPHYRGKFGKDCNKSVV